MLKEKLKKILNIHASTSFIIIFITLVFYCTKYYRQGELVFLKNQFGFFIGFSLLIILAFHILIFLNIDLKRTNEVLKKEIITANETITKIFELTNTLFKKHNIHNDSNVELHRNTRECIFNIRKKD